MERKLSLDGVESRFAEIDTGETEETTAENLATFAVADAEDPADTVTLEAYKAQRKCLVEPAQSTVQPYHEFGTISTEQMVKDAGQILDEFASDYKKMAKGDVFYDTSGDLKHDVYTDLFCSKANQARIRNAIGRLDSGLGTKHELIETDDIDPFFSESNVLELKRRLDDIKAGTASLEEHELIEED